MISCTKFTWKMCINILVNFYIYQLNIRDAQKNTSCNFPDITHISDRISRFFEWNKIAKYSKTYVKRLLSKRPQRTSDSLNEGLPIKIVRKKFQRKRYFFLQKDSTFNSRIICKSVFLIGQMLIKKYGLKTRFLLFNI